MKKFLCVLCVLCGSIFSFGLDRHAFTFTDYDLTVTITPASSEFEATGKITLRNDSAEPQKVGTLQISSSLEWKVITIGGKPVQFVSQPYTSDIDHTGTLNEAIVTLPTPVPPRGTVVIDVSYAGTITQDANRLTRIGVPEKTALASDWDRIGDPFTAVRGVGYVTWYPISTEAASLTFESQLSDEIGAWKQRGIDAAMRIDLCEFNEHPSASSGRINAGKPQSLMNDTPLVAIRAASTSVVGPGGPSRSCLAFNFERLALKVPLFSLGLYEHILPSREVPVWIDFLAGRQQIAEEYARVITDLTPFVTDWFGAPKQTVRVVELPWPGAAPWESGPMLLTPLVDEPHSKLELTLVHQLTHAAFESPRLWVYEGLAHFAQVLDRERVDGRKEALDYMQAQSQSLLAAQQPDMPNAPGRKETTDNRERKPLVTTTDEVFYRTKAMWVWWMLRDMVGDKALQAALHAYKPEEDRERKPLVTTTDEVFYRTKAMWVWWMLRDMVGDKALQAALHAYKPEDDREPSYMQRLVQAQTRQDLEWFFDDWVYRDRGLPDFHIDSVHPRKMMNGNTLVTVTVENRGDAGAEVPVVVETAHGNVTRRVLVKAHEKAVLRVETPEQPKKVTVNDGSVPEVVRKDNSVEVTVPST